MDRSAAPACLVWPPDLFSLPEFMVAKHIILTLVVGAGFMAMFLKVAPPACTAMQIAGVCLVALGFVFWTVARFQLGCSFTVTAQARHLVTGGLYSKIRNPIYFFGSWMILGIILFVGRPLWLLIFVVLVPLQIWRAGKESRVLEEKFGNEYRAYRAGTWF